MTGGFLAGAELEFADGLNCLIGGRGAGKTTVLEFLRFGLGLMPAPKMNAQHAEPSMEIIKSTRHSKITGDFAEGLVLYWLSKYGFECARIDHTRVD